MSYSYQDERSKLFTEHGQAAILKIMKNAAYMCNVAGAFNGMMAVTGTGLGDSFQMMAALDRLVELGEIREITGHDVRGQDRVFVMGGK